MKRIVMLALSIALFAFNSFTQQSGRTVVNFNSGWKFAKGDFPGAENTNFKDDGWRSLDLPHDWSIEGPFSSEWASATGYLPGGIGWYRKTFKMPVDATGKLISIYFEGVYNNSEVWINGHYLGKRPNGYISFQYNLTPYLNLKEINTIAVKVDHTKYGDSRWYTGSGIYRDVFLVSTEKTHISQWGICVKTPEVSAERAKVSALVKLENTSDQTAEIKIENIIMSGRNTIATNTRSLKMLPSTEMDIADSFIINKPQLWDVENPHLYKLITIVSQNGKILDNVPTTFGIRDIKFDANKGFFLNGKNLKLKGVCIHHDAGALGAAVPKKVWERRLKILKEMGCNAIRTSHNPPSTDLLDLCDEMGFLVKDETFDEWELPKRKWLQGWNKGEPGQDGYAGYFEEWHKQDQTDHILRDRNHPSVIMWSIGNEVDYPTDPYTHPILNSEDNPQTWAKHNPQLPDGNRMGPIARELVAIIKNIDNTRPVSSGLASVLMSNETGYADALDAVGYNYQEFRYAKDHAKYPNRIIFGSENGMALDAWNAVVNNDYVIGQFLWTGIEYLGEAGKFPNRSNKAGTIDLAGNKKTEFYFRQSLWSDKPMVYIGASEVTANKERAGLWTHKRAEPTWNWQQGQNIRISAFSNCDEVELFLNGKSLVKKDMKGEPSRVLSWEIPFEAGTLKAVARSGGKEIALYELKTAGEPERLIATTDKKILQADKKDVAHIEVNIADKFSNAVYSANNEINCEITGPARLLGLEDSNPSNIESYTDNIQKAFHGKVLVYIQSLDKPGKVTVKLSSPGLKPVLVEIDIKK